MHANSYQTATFTKNCNNTDHFSSPFCTKFIYNVYINAPWWDYGKMHTTDVLPRKKVNILKINLQSMFRAAKNRKWCTRWWLLHGDNDALMWQLGFKYTAFPFPCFLLPVSLRHCLQQLINHCWWLQFFPSFPIYICSGQFKYGIQHVPRSWLQLVFSCLSGSLWRIGTSLGPKSTPRTELHSHCRKTMFEIYRRCRQHGFP